MDTSTNETVAMKNVVVPKTLPMKYKAMLFANMSFINSHVADPAQRDMLFSKLPIFKTVAEQIAYFDEEADMKKVEQTIFKPMLKDQKQKEKEANKPVKAKKEPAKKKQKKAEGEPAPAAKQVLIPVIQIVITSNDVNITDEIPDEQELEFENEYPDAKVPVETVLPTTTEEVVVPAPAAAAAADVKKPKAPRKKKNPETVLQTTTEEVVVVPTEVSSEAVKKAKAPRKEGAEKTKAPRKKKAMEAPPAPPATGDSEDYFMIPPSVIPEGKYWTKDENYRNGPIYANAKDADGDSTPGSVVGRLEDGNAIFEVVV